MLADSIDAVVTAFQPFGVFVVQRHIDIIKVIDLLHIVLKSLPYSHRLLDCLCRAVREVGTLLSLPGSRENLLYIDVDVLA